jgi:hypothetical protein
MISKQQSNDRRLHFTDIHLDNHIYRIRVANFTAFGMASSPENRHLSRALHQTTALAPAALHHVGNFLLFVHNAFFSLQFCQLTMRDADNEMDFLTVVTSSILQKWS